MAGLEQIVYKKQAGQRQKINRFLSVFVSLCLFPNFLSLFTSMFKNKGNASQDQRPRTKQLAYPPPPF